MGNIMDSVPMERERTVDVTKEILEELRDLVNTVDHSIVGLAKSVDSMQAACEMLLIQYESSKPDSLDSEDRIKSEKDLALYLLRTINESVYDHKFIAIGSVMKLLKFITEKVNKHVDTSFREELDFTVDKYNKSKEFTNASNIDGISYCDSRIEGLWEEIGRLKRINSSQKKQIHSLNKKEEELVDENGLLNKTLTELENSTKDIETEIFAIKEDRSKIVTENEEKERKICNLEKQIEIGKKNEKFHLEKKEKEISEKDNGLAEFHRKINNQEKNIEALQQERLEENRGFQKKIEQLNSDNRLLAEDKLALHEELENVNRKKIICVQINNTCSTQYKDALIQLLKSKIETQDLKLDVAMPVSPKQVKSEIPILYAITPFDSYRPLEWTVADHTKGIKVTSKVALLVVHSTYKDSIKPSDATLKRNDKTYESCGGIFDMTYEYKSKCFSTNILNEKSINGLVNFIETEGVKVSRWKLFLEYLKV